MMLILTLHLASNTTKHLVMICKSPAQQHEEDKENWNPYLSWSCFTMATTLKTNLFWGKIELEPFLWINFHMAIIIAMFESDLMASIYTVLFSLSLTKNSSFLKHSWWSEKTGWRKLHQGSINVLYIFQPTGVFFVGYNYLRQMRRCLHLGTFLAEKLVRLIASSLICFFPACSSSLEPLV